MGSWVSTLSTAAQIAGLAGITVIALVLTTLRGIYKSIRPLPPTKKQLKEEPFDKHPLFKYIPQLKSKVAWRQIGNYPTPIHKCEVGNASFYVKREDLASKVYGGNKVRTLQHQLATCEAYKEQNPKAKFITVGSGGSNQAVASCVHGLKTFGVEIFSTYPMPDPPDMDNAINMLSVLSFPVKVSTGATIFRSLQAIGSALITGNDKVFMPGGNNVTGILGQIGGALELAEQIQNGEVEDPEAIYVAAGSNCTSTGILMGICIARTIPSLNKAFRNPNFKLVVVPIHHGAAGAQRNLGLFFKSISKYIPMTPMHGIIQTSEFIASCGGPDYKDICLEGFHAMVEYVADHDYIGEYGGHSKNSILASKEYDSDGRMVDLKGNNVQDLWLCGHFAAKPMAVLLDRLRSKNGTKSSSETSKIIFWQTKSAVLPKGPIDEYPRMQQLTDSSKEMAKWFFEAEAHSSLRPGLVTPDQGRKTYEKLMTPTEI